MPYFIRCLAVTRSLHARCMKRIAASPTPHLINTLLQQGVFRSGEWRNRFNGLSHLLTLSRFDALTLLTLLTLFPARSHANVYATNIRLNGGLTNIVVPAVTNLIISYSL